MVKFDDVSKAVDDLFKKPFNSGKVNCDVKCGTFTLKSTSKDGAIASNVEVKIDDALMGLGKGTTLPCTKKFDGKNLKFEFAKSFNDVKLSLDTSFTPASTGIGNVIKVDYSGNGVTTGLQVAAKDGVNFDIGGTKFHAVAGLKGHTVGLKGALSNPGALEFVYSPNNNIFLHTDLNKYDLSLHMTGSAHQVGLKYGWLMGSQHSNFSFAAKKTLANGANVHVKSDLSGVTEVAHVSNVKLGEFDAFKCTLGAQFDVLKWGAAPTFGAGFEFTL